MVGEKCPFDASVLLESPRLWEKVLDEVEMFVGVLDRRGRVLLINRAAERATGRDREEVIGQPAIDTFIPVEERAEVGAALERLLAAPTAISVESHLVAKGGDRRFVHWSGVSEAGGGGGDRNEVQTVVITGVDRTRERELEHELARADEALRQRMGAELHDMLASHLAGMAMLGAAFARQVEKGTADGAEALRKLTEMAQKASDQVRALSHSFAAPELEAAGLVEALEQLGARTEAASGVACSCTADDRARTIAPTGEVAVHLYRIAQEALHNAVMHAAPSQVELVLKTKKVREPTEGKPERRVLFVLAICDDGAGIPEDATEGVGLRSMRRRARLVGATLHVERSEAGGTHVRCTLPRPEPSSVE